MKSKEVTQSSVSWTKEQQQVISLRNRNILVSAAAGSGKTAVLVERIITMILDEENPIDIDKLLVVTFTNAAAAEMRERVLAAIEKKVEQEPENLHLRRQVTLVRNAQITTLHSFCQSVIRNYFDTIDLDPGFRIGDEAELGLLKNQVLDGMFEAHYQEDEDFLELIECYSGGKSDTGLRSLVLDLFHFAMSNPWPKEWFEEIKGAFELENSDDMEHTEWMVFLKEYIHQVCVDLQEKNQFAKEVCLGPGGPYMYENAINADGEYLNELLSATTYTELGNLILENKWTRLSAKKDDTVSDEKKKQVQELRDVVKKALDDIKKQFFFQEAQQMVLDMQSLKKPVHKLVELTEEFMDLFRELKEEKKVMDFNDLEHYALDILLKRENGKAVPTQVAVGYQNEFAEIMVDEYQDSNQVQEAILTSIAVKAGETPNLFMVGDVKQSIYKFRLARPELFMEKYDTYSLEEDVRQRIDLHKNFRSRPIVLDTVNAIFRVIMKKSLGKVEYDEKAALYVGNTSFPEQGRISDSTELLLYTQGEAEEETRLSSKELEARMVATRIEELVKPETGLEVMDKITGENRTCNYGDIVILLRTLEGWSDTFLGVLKNHGIPCYTDTRTGYFSTYEIRTILQFLKIVDNPRQDIPLVAVLRSPLGGFSGEELAQMRNRYPDLEWIDTVEAFGGLHTYGQDLLKPEETTLSKKADAFMKQLEHFREMITYLSIYRLLEVIYEETGFYDYVSVMPNGAQRRDNLELLLQKALDMESTGFSTLFHFNRYIEKLHKYEVDFGEAAGGEDTKNAVRIMSIHKSKGLEFPVVFVSGMSKAFNQQDAKRKMVLHADLGIGPDVIDYKKRTKVPSIMKRIISKMTVLENLGEEIRVLYVALTRAKEKLIMTGYVGDAEKQFLAWESIGGERMDYFSRISAKNYLDWVAPVALFRNGKDFKVACYSFEQLLKNEVEHQIMGLLKKQELLEWDTEKVYDSVFYEALEKRKDYAYPFESEREIKSKMTVTELKRLGQLSDIEDSESLLEEKFEERETVQAKNPSVMEEDVPVPAFLKPKEEINGANRGIIYHKVLEKLLIANVRQEGDVEKELQRMVACGFLKEEETNAIRPQKIFYFAKTDLGKRMMEAQQVNRLWKEQPFVIGISARNVKPQWESDELVLVQGIIDAYFEEEDGYVLVDYKSDYVKKEQELVERYSAQLDYYQKALEQITGKKVKEKIIYSLCLNKEIVLP